MPGRPWGAVRRPPRFPRPAPGRARGVTPAPTSRRRRGGPASVPSVGPAAEGLAVEKLCHHRRPHRPGSGARVGWVRPGRARMVWLEPVDVDCHGGTAPEAGSAYTCLGRHRHGALPPRAQLAHLDCVEQRRGSSRPRGPSWSALVRWQTSQDRT